MSKKETRLSDALRRMTNENFLSKMTYPGDGRIWDLDKKAWVEKSDGVKSVSEWFRSQGIVSEPSEWSKPLKEILGGNHVHSGNM